MSFVLIAALPLLSIPFCFIFLCSVPGAPPETVEGHNTSSTRIKVKWGEVPTDKRHGNIVNYTVIYKLSEGDPEMKKVVDSPTRETVLTNLTRYTAYGIQVLAATVKGDGPRSKTIIVWTDEDGKYKEKNIKSLLQSQGDSVGFQPMPPTKVAIGQRPLRLIMYHDIQYVLIIRF